MKITFKLHRWEIYDDFYYFKKKCCETVYASLQNGHKSHDRFNNVISPFSIKNKGRYRI